MDTLKNSKNGPSNFIPVDQGNLSEGDAMLEKSDFTSTILFPTLPGLKDKLDILISETEEKLKLNSDKIIDIIKRLSVLKISQEDIKNSNISKTLRSLIEKKGIDEAVKMTKKLIANWKKKLIESKEDDSTSKSDQIKSNNNPIIDVKEESTYDADKKVTYKAKIEKSEKDPTRKNTKTLIYNSLLKWEENVDQVYNIAIDIEEGLYKEYYIKQSREKAKYLKQTKHVVMNIQNNKDFVTKVIKGDLKGESIAVMSPQDFASEERKEMRKKLMEDAFNARRSDWNRIKNPGNPGMYRCGKCKSNKTTYYQAQIRRADEPMTTFITCLECNHSWKQ